MKALRNALIGLALATSLALPASAELLTFEFAGTVGNVPAVLAGDIISIGDSWSYAYTFDSTAPDTMPANPASGSYALTSSTLTIGTTTWTGTSPNLLSIGDGVGGDVFAIVNAMSGPTVAGSLPVQSEIFLLDPSGTVYSSDSLPTTPPNLAAFSVLSSAFRFHDPGPGGGSFGIALVMESSSVVVRSIPASSSRGLFVTGLLFMSALAMLGLRCVRRSAAQPADLVQLGDERIVPAEDL